VLSEVACDETKVRFLGLDPRHHAAQPLAATAVDVVQVVDHHEAKAGTLFAERMARPRSGGQQRSGAEATKYLTAAANGEELSPEYLT
jgi:hypothetical protein